MGLADECTGAELFELGQLGAGEEGGHFRGAGHCGDLLGEFREGHEQATRHARVYGGRAGEDEGEFAARFALAVIDAGAVGWGAGFEGCGGRFDEGVAFGCVCSDQGDAAFAFSAGLAAAEFLHEGGWRGAGGPYQVRRGAEWIGARLWWGAGE